MWAPLTAFDNLNTNNSADNEIFIKRSPEQRHVLKNGISNLNNPSVAFNHGISIEVNVHNEHQLGI